MSREIDERIVSMEFDNSNFEKNVKTSMSTLDRLKQALNFKGASKGIEAVESAANKVNFSGMTKAVDEIGVRFSGLQVVAATALANITNSVVNAGRQMVNALTFEPLKSGFAEYETQIGSIQTILSNTRHEGTNLQQVTDALDELNTYADQTIYNFTEMTRNIGTFTAAGVSLDTSVAAIKGIANLAAVSGSTSVQASSAMYQLSQALAAGRVSLMDWNSVVNAGMGGKVFQDALVRTSELMGTGAKQAIEAYGSFRESLTEGQWLTTDVLTETLKQISGAYSEAELISQGYTQEQAAEIVALADDAKGAATNVRTFSQLIDTTMEALGSGWTNTWELIIGNFEEAKTLFTDMSKVISDAVQQSADARNNMLQGWRDLGGREDLIAGLQNVFEGLLSVIEPIQEAFSEIFPPMTAENLAKITENFKNFTENLKLSDEAAANVKRIFEGLFSAIKAIGSVVGDLFGGVGTFLSNAAGGFENILGFAGGIGDFIKNVSNAATETDAFGAVVHTLATAFGQAFTSITSFLSGGVSKMGDMFSGVSDILSGAADVIINAATDIASGIRNILGTADFGSIIDVFNSGMLAALVTSVRNWFDKLTGGVEDSSSGLIDTITDMVSGVGDSVTDILDSVRSSLEVWQTSLKAGILLKIATAVAILVAALTVLASINPDRLSDSLGAITVLFAELLAAMTAFTKLNTTFEQLTGIGTMIAMATAIAILAGAMKSLSDMDADQIMQGVNGIAGLATVMLLLTKALSSGGMITKGSFQLIMMAASLKVLASVAEDMGSLDFDTMQQGLIGVAGLMAEMAIFSNIVKSDGIFKTAAAMVVLGAAFEILIDVVRNFGSMDLKTLGVGIGSVAGIMGVFAVFTRALPKGTTFVKAAAGILLMTVALNALEPVMASFANIGLEGVATGMFGIAGVLRSLTKFLEPMLALNITDMAGLMWAIPELIGSLQSIADAMTSMSGLSATDIAGALITMTVSFELLMKMIEKLDRMDIGDMAALAVAMPMVTESLKSVAEAISIISGLGFEGSLSAIVAFGGAMKALEIGLDAIKGNVTSVGALMLVSVALIALATAITLISNSGIIGVITSFIALSGAMTIIGTATKIIKPLIPTMYSFAGAIATFGASLIALGVGTAATGAGLIFLVTGLAGALLTFSVMDPLNAAKGIAVLAAAFTTMGVAAKVLKPLIPSITQLSMSIASLGLSCMAVSIGIAVLVAGLTALGSIGEEGAMSIVNTLKALIVGISEMIPEIITSLMSSFKAVFEGILGVITEMAPQIAESFLTVTMETMQSMSEYGPEIAGFFIDFLIGVINTVADRIPELVPAVSNLVQSLFNEITKALSSWEGSGDALNTGVGVLSGLTVLILGFNAIRGLVPGAMIGALQVAAFAVEVGAIIAALGALEQLTGASSFIQSGGDLLQSLGTAIGQFIGGIAGGMLEGATSTLPQVGTSLSQFMTNLSPFLAGAQMIDPSIMDGISALVECIALLTGANILNSLGEFLTGDSDFSGLTDKLIPFGQAIVQFSNIVSGIDPAAVSAAAQAGTALSQLASSLPKEGGLAQAIFGETVDMASFGTQLVAFGGALLAYSTAVAGIQIEPIMQSAQAGQALSELANSLPKEGGLAQAIFGGTTGMEEFGAQLLAFGEALSGYSGSVSGLDIESITNSAKAGEALSTLANSLPDDGGLAQWIFGGSDLGDFGIQLKSFGEALGTYVESLADVDFTKITQSINAIRNLSTVVNDAVTMDTSGLANLERFSDIGSALESYYASVSEFDAGVLSASISSLNNLVDFITSLVGLDTSGISSFGSAVTQLGQTSFDGLVSVFQNSDLSGAGFNLAQSLSDGFMNGLASMATTFSSSISSLTTTISSQNGEFTGKGKENATAYASGITSGVAEVRAAVTAMAASAAGAIGSNYSTFYNAGLNLAQGFAQGISSGAYAARVAATAMANAAARAAQTALDEHSPSRVLRQIGLYFGEGFVNGIKEYNYEAYNAGVNLTDFAVEGASRMAGLYETFGDIGQAIKDISALSEKLSTVKKKDTETDKESTEEKSKLSEALKSVADSTQALLDRRNDLAAFQKLLSRTDVSMSDAFIGELLDQNGVYAGALTEMVELTDDQLQQLESVYNQSKAAESMENLFTTLSDSIKDMSDNIKQLDATQEMFERLGHHLSDDFITELLDSSGMYADVMTELVRLTDDDLTKISALFDKQLDAQKTLEFTQVLHDSLADLRTTQADIENIGQILYRTGMNFSDSFMKEVLDSGGMYADILEQMGNATDSQLREIAWRFDRSKIYEYVQELTDALIENDGLSAAFDIYGTNLEELVDNLYDFGLEVSDVTDSITGFAETVRDGFSKMSIKDQTGLKEFTDNLNNNLIVAKEWENNVNRVFGQIKDYPFADDFRKEILEGGFEKYGRLMSELAGKTKSEIINLIGLWNTADIYGNKLGTDVVESILPNKGVSKDIGTEMAQGIAQGIEEGQYAVTEAITTLCQNAEQTTKDYFGIHSPSKLMEKIGGYVTLGFANGIADGASSVYNSMDLIYRSIDYLSSLDEDDLAIHPVIQPVIDMDDMYDKIALLNSAFANQPSSYVMGTVDSINSALGQNGVGSAAVMANMKNSIDTLAGKIDAIDPDNFGTTFNQYNNSPKALSTATIYRQTKNQISLARSRVNKNSKKQ